MAAREGRNLSVPPGTGSTAPRPFFRRAITPEPERPGRFGVGSHQAPDETGEAQKRSLTQSDEVHLKTGPYQVAAAGARRPAAPSPSNVVGPNGTPTDDVSDTVCPILLAMSKWED